MYGYWGCHHADKKMNEVFPMIGENLEKTLNFLIFQLYILASVHRCWPGSSQKKWILSSLFSNEISNGKL